MKKLLSAALAVTMAASLAACGGGQAQTGASAAESKDQGSSDDKAQTFKIGSIGPVTGPAASYGQSVENSLKLAVDEINAAGGINGYQVEMNFQDDENDSEKSVNAYNTLKDWGMQMLLGPTTSKPTIAVESEAAADNMFLLTPSGSAVDCITAGDNAFRVCFNDPAQGKVSADYISEHQLGMKVGIIYDSSTEYSDGIRASFEEEAAAKGLEIVAKEAFTSDNNTDFSVQLDKMKEAGADLVFMPIYYQEASVILKQANDKDYHPTFFGVDGLDGLLSVENFDKSLAEGVMLLTPFSVDEESSADYVKAYRDQFGVEPIQFGADEYDGVYAVKAALEKANATPDMSASELCDLLKKAMTEISVDGLTGSQMKWTADGEPNKTPKAVRIENGNYVMQE